MAKKSEATGTLAEIESVRVTIANLKDEIDWLAKAPIPPKSVEERVKSHVETLAAAYVADAPLMQIASPESGAEALRNFLNHGIAAPGYGRPLLAEFACFILGDRVVEQVCAAIDTHGLACGPALPERKASIARLRKELFELECREEGLVCTAEDLGIGIARRQDADPAAVLGFDPQGTMPLLGIGYRGGKHIDVVADRAPAAVVQNI